jgi:hypothetical protein
MLLCLCTSSNGQDFFSPTAFLANAQLDENVSYQKEKLTFLSTISHKLPFIDQLEVRTETNEFDYRKQEYLLRVSPNNPKAIKAQDQYQETNRYLAKTEMDAQLGKALRQRYDLLIKYFNYQNQLEIVRKYDTLFADQVTVLKRSVSLPGFDIIQLIEAEDRAQDNKREILDLETALWTMKKEMQQKMDTDHTLKIVADKLLTVSELKTVVTTLGPANLATHNDLQYLSAKVYNSMMEYEWEASKTKFSIGYVQAKYGFDPTDSFRKSFSIGIGFEIPLKGMARLDLNELQIKNYELQSNYRSLKTLLSEQEHALRQQLDNLLRKHDLIRNQLTDSRAEFALNEYRKITDTSPKALLRLRENTLKKELLMQKLELEIMRTFIELLDTSGRLAIRPLQNYLSKDLERF